jgi:hypothetical protein
MTLPVRLPPSADLPLLKQQKQRAMPRGRPFAKGRSGNPKGRPRRARDKVNRVAEALFDREAEGLTRKAFELAHEGNVAALKACLDRIVPPRRERSVSFTMPRIKGAADLAPAMGAVANAAAEGAITPGEAAHFAQLVDTMVRAIQTTDFEQRLRQLEPAKPDTNLSRRQTKP